MDAACQESPGCSYTLHSSITTLCVQNIFSFQIDHNFDIHNETFKYKEFSITLMLPTIQEMMRQIFPVYQNINDATHEMAEGKILQSLNKHSSITPGGEGCVCSSGVLVCKAKYFHRHQKQFRLSRRGKLCATLAVAGQGRGWLGGAAIITSTTQFLHFRELADYTQLAVATSPHPVIRELSTGLRDRWKHLLGLPQLSI